MNSKKIVYPYIPNSEPQVQKEMLQEIGANSISELFSNIPEKLLLHKKMNLPKPFLSEYELKRHIESILSKNSTCKENISFLGAGCWQHYVPAVVDEVIHRSEFLTAYAGEPYEDHGRFQVLFEYASMMGDMLEMDVVNIPTYDWSQAASTSLRMSCRITGRDEVIVSKTINPNRLLVIKNYCNPNVNVVMLDFDSKTGLVDINDLEKKISNKTAGVYIENPSYLGSIEPNGAKLSEIIHKAGALFLVGVNPSSLGVLTPPINYGADIVCGDLQPLGIHMNYGGGVAGFIATRDEKEFVSEYPSRLFGIAPTENCEWGFGDVMWERTSFANRESSKEFVGTAAALWGIAAGVYLAVMGPEGMQELGKGIIQRSLYAQKEIGKIKGVKVPVFQSANYSEFVVDFNNSGKTIKEINKALLKKGIFGGKDLSKDFSQFGQSALYCVTEIHTKEDIDKLAFALKEVF